MGYTLVLICPQSEKDPKHYQYLFLQQTGARDRMQMKYWLIFISYIMFWNISDTLMFCAAIFSDEQKFMDL